MYIYIYIYREIYYIVLLYCILFIFTACIVVLQEGPVVETICANMEPRVPTQQRDTIAPVYRFT